MVAASNLVSGSKRVVSSTSKSTVKKLLEFRSCSSSMSSNPPNSNSEQEDYDYLPNSHNSQEITTSENTSAGYLRNMGCSSAESDVESSPNNLEVFDESERSSSSEILLETNKFSRN